MKDLFFSRLLAFLIFVSGAQARDVPLVSAVQVPIIADGRQIGSVNLPAGSSVTVVSIDSDGVMVSRGGGTPFKVAREVISPDALPVTQATTPVPSPMPSPLVLGPSSTASVSPVTPVHVPTPAVDPKQTEWDAGPIRGASLDIARFRWWAPPDAKNLRGVMVLIPGRNGDGRGLTGDKNWQKFASEMQLALVGCNFYGEKDHFTYQHDPTGEVGRAINEAVEKLAANNGYLDLRSPLLVFWGHSAGSIVSQVYLKRYPERVLAAINLKGPDGPGETSFAKNAVPYLVIIGAKDKPEWVKGALANYETGRKGGAVWTLALSLTEGHEGGKSLPLMLAFLRSVIRQRLGPVTTSQSAFASSNAPRRLSSSDGWLGDLKTGEIAPQSSYSGNRSDATWLPDETTAKAWQDFLRGK